MESYRGLDFRPPVETGAQGPVYEFRTYRLKIHGLMPTMGKWEAAIPGRMDYSRLTVAMYGLDGAPRLTQIRPHASLEARAKVRAQSVSRGREMAAERGAGPPDARHDLADRDAPALLALQ